MANTDIADLGKGDKIALSPGGENKLGAKGNGSLKAGAIVNRITATGKVAGTDLGANDLFHGILGKRYDTDIDTAIADNDPCDIIVPKSGNKYLIRIDDPAGAYATGGPLTWSANAGVLKKCTNLATTLERNVAYVAEQDLANGDTVAIVRWA